MSATYNELLLSDLDRARSLLGDTAIDPPEDALHSDKHIAAVLEQHTTFAAAVAWLADELVARFSQEPVKVRLKDGTSVDYSDRVSIWEKLATRMRAGVAAAASDSTAAPATSQAVSTQAVW
jgi:predicted Rdx family selenoprotein